MNYETIQYEVADDKVATITINRPQAMNSFTAQMLREFRHVWERVRHDANVNAVFLRGADGRAFSTGADVKASSGENVLGSTESWNMEDPGQSLGPKANKLWKPVVTAVHGLCCGGAFYWLNESDVIICSEDAQFFDPHVDYGLTCAVEPVGQSYRMPLGDVLRIALFGNDERVTAQSAKEMRLVSEVLPDREALWQRGRELAARLAAKPSEALQGSVFAIWSSLELPRSAAIDQAFKHCLITAPGGQSKLGHEKMMKAPRKEPELR
jgi:enoyl-CoA hydratase/carnithine racemase